MVSSLALPQAFSKEAKEPDEIHPTHSLPKQAGFSLTKLYLGWNEALPLLDAR